MLLSPSFSFSISVSLNMSSIRNCEPAPAAAHSPYSDEEIEDEIESENPPPIQECFIVKLNRALYEKMVIIKEFRTILILLLILLGYSVK